MENLQADPDGTSESSDMHKVALANDASAADSSAALDANAPVTELADATPKEEDAEAASEDRPPAEEPYEFEHCTIQIGIQLLPDDGNPAGRPVVIGVRNHADTPIIAMTRLSTLQLPQIVTDLLARLQADLPTRQKAKEEAAAKKRAEAEAAKAKREAAGRAKPKTKPAHKPKVGLDKAPDSGPTGNPVSKPTSAPAPAMEAPAAAAQISLF